MNPMNLLQLRGAWTQFKSNHPKFLRFLSAVCQKSMEEGTVIEFRVTSPDGREVSSNLRLKADDIALFKELQELLR